VPHTPPAGTAHPAEVGDRGDGTYDIRFTVHAAGPFQLALAAAGAGAGGPRLVFDGVCRPGRAAAQARAAARHAHACVLPRAGAHRPFNLHALGLHRLRVQEALVRLHRALLDLPAYTAVVAGATGRVCVARADAFGNALASGAGQAALAVAWEGPAPVATAVTELSGGRAEVAFVARAAGEYALALRCRGQEPLVGGVLAAVRVRPGPANAAACAAALAGEAPGGGVEVGAPARVAVDLRDACGNATRDLGGQARPSRICLRPEVARAAGALASVSGRGSHAELKHADARVLRLVERKSRICRRWSWRRRGPPRSRLRPRAATALARASTLRRSSWPATTSDYVLCVTLGDAMLPGWPRVLHARPAASDAGRCWLSGAALGGVVAGAPTCALERRCASKLGTHGRAHAGVQGTSRVFARTAAPLSPPAGCPQRCPAHTIVPSRLQNV